MINGILEKQCTKCNEWFADTEENFYYKNRSKPEMGFVPRCKRCSIEDTQEYERNDPEKVRNCRLRSYQKHKESKNQRNKNWQSKNREHLKEYNKQYIKDNPEKVKEYGYKRLNKNHKISEKEWNSCKEYFNNSCAYCGMSETEHKTKHKNRGLNKEHVDHEGSVYLDNCVPACYRCNLCKWLYPMEEWYRKQQYFDEERLQKILKWVNEDYKQFEKKK
jgi:hypothetical protein